MFNKTFATATICLGLSLGLGLASTSAAQSYKTWAGRNVTAVQELLAEDRVLGGVHTDIIALEDEVTCITCIYLFHISYDFDLFCKII